MKKAEKVVFTVELDKKSIKEAVGTKIKKTDMKKIQEGLDNSEYLYSKVVEEIDLILEEPLKETKRKKAGKTAV